jgi:MoaA/NifB/PqqE/SkfB family radical SAM enzyme
MDWFNSDYMNNIRKQMIDDKPLKECAGCYKLEKLGVWSPRIDKPEDTSKDIKWMNIKFGNMCNLKCKMCFPFSSSELMNEYKELGWDKDDPNSETPWKYFPNYMQSDFDWPNNPKALAALEKVTRLVNKLHFTGGEPMISTAFFKYLKYCIDNNFAKNIDLVVTTNATTIHPMFVKIIKEFKSLHLMCSIDGTDKVYDYVRYPGNWNKTYANFKKYHDIMKDMPNAYLTYNTTVQYFNLHNLVDIAKALDPYVLRKQSEILVVHDPAYMTYKLLPDDFINQCLKQLFNYVIDRSNDEGMTVVTMARNFRRDVMDEAVKQQLLTKLKWFVSKQDGHRGINIGDYIPEVAPFLK